MPGKGFAAELVPMLQVANRSEARLKAAVIDRLLAGSHVDGDSVLVSEMTVANWSRRADVVLANGKLWGFEIKSEADSLSRLEGQVETFRSHFEKLIVVVAARFADPATKLIPEGVGLWVEEADGSLKQRIAPRQTPLSRAAAISLMTAAELRRLLHECGMKAPKEANRARLADIAHGLPASDLANAAREAIKRRHRARHAEFLRHRQLHGTLGAIGSLRRVQHRPAELPLPSAPVVVDLEEVVISADNPLLVYAPSGPVLKRRV